METEEQGKNLLNSWQHPTCPSFPGLLTPLQPGQSAEWESVSPCGEQGSAGHIHSKNSKTTTEPSVYFYVPLTGEECVIFSKGGSTCH